MGLYEWINIWCDYYIKYGNMFGNELIEIYVDFERCYKLKLF